MVEKTEKTTEDIFENLVLNAIDYLKISIEELETRPKHSLVNFITAVELFLKARLYKEHWTLLIENVDSEKVNINNLKQGELPTINFKQAIDRLDRLLDIRLSKKAKECLRNLRNHRNKVIHFYHKTYSGKSQKLVSQVLIEQCEAWYYLYNWLLEDWRDIFSDYRRKIVSLHLKIKEHKKFFKGKYNALVEKLKLKEKSGATIVTCKICDCKAMVLSEYADMWYIGQCWVCDYEQNFVEITCPNEKCQKNISLDGAYFTCDSCKTEIDLEYLLDKFKKYIKEDMYCTECYAMPASIVFLNNEYFCLSCFETFHETSSCGWCDTLYAGEINIDTYWYGCEFCEGHLGYYSAKD